MRISSDKPRPIFIVGLPRSGTTLLRAILCAHPSITIAPETHFLNRWMQRSNYPDINSQEGFEKFWEEYINSELFSHLGIEADVVKDRIHATKRYDYKTFFCALMQEYAAKMKKPRWGEKTPDHYRYIDHLLKWFPEGRIIYMLRDPRAAIASLLKVPWAHGAVDLHAKQWCESVHIFEQWVNDGRVRLVKYESLVSDPEHELHDVCGFLGEEYTPAILNQSEESMPIINRTGWAKEALAATRRPITTANIEKWKSSLTSYQVAVVEHIARRKMITYGYEPITAGLNLVQFMRFGQTIALRHIKSIARPAYRRRPSSG